MKKINDFGQKIGGAKKDLWKSRGLQISDLNDMTSIEIDKHVKRDNIWSKIDEDKMIESQGRFLTYWKKQMRLCVNPKCEIDARTYIDNVSKFRDTVMGVKTEKEIYDFASGPLEAVLHYRGYRTYDYVEGYREVLKGNKLLKLVSTFGIQKLKEKMLSTGYGLSKEEFIDEQYAVCPIGGNVAVKYDGLSKKYRVVQKTSHGTYFKYAQTDEIQAALKDAEYILYYDSSILMAGSKESCDKIKKAIVQKMLDLEEEKEKIEKKQKSMKKKRFVPAQLAHVKRNGEIDYRKGINVSGSDFINAFGIRAGEFGNWQSTNDRQTNMNMAFDALLDLSSALDISRKEVSLPGLELGSLALAFGSRGAGSAVAHYEPLREVINLTKMKGAGSLAHEWGHALDHFIGEQFDLKKLASTTLNAMYALNNNSRLPKTFVRLVHDLTLDENNKPTEYFVASNKFDQIMSKEAQGYWASQCELFARAFATFILDSLASQGIRNDYLCGHAESAKTISLDGSNEIIKAFPEGEERKHFNKLFKDLFAELKELGYFHGPIDEYFNTKTKEQRTEKKTINLNSITDVKQLSFTF